MKMGNGRRKGGKGKGMEEGREEKKKRKEGNLRSTAGKPCNVKSMLMARAVGKKQGENDLSVICSKEIYLQCQSHSECTQVIMADS